MFTRLYFHESHPSAIESFSLVLLDNGQDPEFTKLLCRHDFIPEMGTTLHFAIATLNRKVENRGGCIPTPFSPSSHLCPEKFYKPGDVWRSIISPTGWTSAFSASWEEILPAVSMFSFLIWPVVFMILGEACWDSALPSFTCRLLDLPF